MQQIKGVLFDMDGVILDSEKLYTRFWREGAQALGFSMTHEMALGMRSLSAEVGERQLKAYLGDEIDYQAVKEKRIELMNAYIAEHGIDLKPGIHELLVFLKERGIKTAVATSSPLDRTREYLSQVGLVDSFDELVSAKMVAQGKPEPDVYLYAASRLGLAPEECMVLEDSPTGLTAGYRAGCVAVLVPDLDQPDEATRKMAYAVAENLLSVRGLITEGIQDC